MPVQDDGTWLPKVSGLLDMYQELSLVMNAEFHSGYLHRERLLCVKVVLVHSSYFMSSLNHQVTGSPLSDQPQGFPMSAPLPSQGAYLAASLIRQRKTSFFLMTRILVIAPPQPVSEEPLYYIARSTTFYTRST